MSLDDYRVVGRPEHVMFEKNFLQIMLRFGIFERGFCNLNVADRHGQISGSNIFFHLRFLASLYRDCSPGDERLLALVGLLLLRKNCARLADSGLRDLYRRLSVDHSGSGFSEAGFLFGAVQTCQDIAFFYPVAMIGIQFDKRGTDLEANFRQDARFYGAQTEDLYRHIPGWPQDLHRQRSHKDEQKHCGPRNGDPQQGQKIPQKTFSHDAPLSPSAPTFPKAKPLS